MMSPEPETDDVARYQFARRRGDPFAVPQDPRFRSQLGFQRLDRVAGLPLLPEPDQAVGEQQDEDDGEVRPVAHDGGQDRRRLDHPGDRPPEIAKELQQRVGLLLGDLVRAILVQPPGGLFLGQAVGRRAQPGFQVRHRHGVQIAVGRRRVSIPGCRQGLFPVTYSGLHLCDTPRLAGRSRHHDYGDCGQANQFLRDAAEKKPLQLSLAALADHDCVDLPLARVIKGRRDRIPVARPEDRRLAARGGGKSSPPSAAA